MEFRCNYLVNQQKKNECLYFYAQARDAETISDMKINNSKLSQVFTFIYLDFIES